MRFKGRALYTLLWITMMGSILAACGSGGQDTGNTGSTAAAGKEAETATSYPPASLVITSSSGWTDDAFWQRFEPVREKFPQYTFKYIQSGKGTSYSELIAANQDIDIYFDSVASFPNTLTFGLGYDMTNLIKKHNVDLAKIEPSMVNTMRSFSTKGELYGLPVLTNTLALYYNRDIFNQLAVPMPKDGMSWDEVNELNRRLSRTDRDIQFVGIAYMFNHYWDINPFSIPYVNNDRATINNGKFNPLFQTILNSASAPGYKDFVNANKKIPDRGDFTAGRAAMFAGLANSHLNLAPDYEKINWDVLRYPVYKESPNPYPQAYPTYFAVSATSKFKDQSMEVIKYLVSEEFQLSVSKSGTIPVVFSPAILNSFSSDLPYHQDKNLKTLLYPKFAPGAVTLRDPVVRNIYFKENLLPYARGEMDLNTLLRTAEEEANKALEAVKAQ